MRILLILLPLLRLVPTGSHWFPEPVNADWFPTALPYGAGTSRELVREPVKKVTGSQQREPDDPSETTHRTTPTAPPSTHPETKPSGHRIDRPRIVISELQGRTYTPEEKSVALATYAEHGLARAHDVHDIPKSTLRKWAMGSGMDTSEIAGRSVEQTQAASAARATRCEELRLELRESFLVAAADMLDRLDEEHIDFRGQQAKEVTFPKAPADACRNYVTAAAILIDKYRLEAGEATDRTELLGVPADEARKELAQVIDLALARRVS
jgi:transposase-like protein